MTNRYSYRGLMTLPAWGLFDADDILVASVRAQSAPAARDLFKIANLSGARVRRL